MNDRGKIGVDTSVIISGIKKDRIKANCHKCINYRTGKGAKNSYCDYYKEIEPNRKTCARYKKVQGSGTKIKSPHKRNCKNVTWDDIRKFIGKDKNNLERMKTKLCVECRHKKKDKCIFFDRKFEDFIESWEK